MQAANQEQKCIDDQILKVTQMKLNDKRCKGTPKYICFLVNKKKVKVFLNIQCFDRMINKFYIIL